MHSTIKEILNHSEAIESGLVRRSLTVTFYSVRALVSLTTALPSPNDMTQVSYDIIYNDGADGYALRVAASFRLLSGGDW